jgi:hypothetical protein
MVRHMVAREPDRITLRALGRATLARQMLLERAKVAPVVAVERLVAVQAQLAKPAFVALWSRVDGLRAEAVRAAIDSKQIVRATMMRATLHMTSAKDYAALRPALSPMLVDGMRKVLRARADGLDFDALIATARRALAKGALGFDELRPALAKAMGHADERALGYAVRTMLPLVQAADGSPWGWATGGAFALAESWLDRPIDATAPPDALVVRYLAALGPATPADAQTWTGLPRLREVFERLRPKLRVFTGPDGHELYDLPKAPRPSEDEDAPVRFLPDWDNVVLGHSDRTRVIDDAHRKLITTGNLGVLATFLVDGRVAGRWKLARAKRRAVLALEPFVAIAPAAKRALEAEGQALARFLEPDAEDYDVKISSRAGRGP